MKFVHSTVLFLTFALISCGNDNGNEPQGGGGSSSSGKNITISSSSDCSNISAEAQQITVNVLCDGDWSISSDSQWLTHFPSGGVKNSASDVKVNIAKNDGFESRTGILTVKSGQSSKQLSITQKAAAKIELSTSSIIFGGQESESTITVNSNTTWRVYSEESWCKATPSNGGAGLTTVTVKVDANDSSSERQATLYIEADGLVVPVAVSQLNDEITVPEGYTLVWHDEFNEGTSLNSDWTYEVQKSGWVNNELQNYVKNPIDGKNTVEINNGFLNINCFKANDGKVYSGRVYAMAKSGWTYGYIEARINLPSGKGTWPAFWMMPVNFKSWPDDGEMDIMEEVGVVPNEVSSSLHARGHYHVENTQVTAARKLPGAEGSFHVYAMEWTPEVITTFVDGQPLLTYRNDGSGDRNWPYHTPFYVILNLAWGGDWGGMNGVDESALPVTMLVDYVRVFQKQ